MLIPTTCRRHLLAKSRSRLKVNLKVDEVDIKVDEVDIKVDEVDIKLDKVDINRGEICDNPGHTAGMHVLNSDIIRYMSIYIEIYRHTHETMNMST